MVARVGALERGARNQWATTSRGRDGVEHAGSHRGPGSRRPRPGNRPRRRRQWPRVAVARPGRRAPVVGQARCGAPHAATMASAARSAAKLAMPRPPPAPARRPRHARRTRPDDKARACYVDNGHGFPRHPSAPPARHPALRALVRETALEPSDFICPSSSTLQSTIRAPSSTMPGVFQCRCRQPRSRSRANGPARVSAEPSFSGCRRRRMRRARAARPRGPVPLSGGRDERGRARPRRHDRRVRRRVHRPRPLRRAAQQPGGGSRSTTTAPSRFSPRWPSSTPSAGADVVAPSDMMDGRVAPSAARSTTNGFEGDGHDELRGEVRERRSTGPSARPPIARRSSATAQATRWTRATCAKRCVRPARRGRGRRHAHGQARARLPRRHSRRCAPRRPCRSSPTTFRASTRCSRPLPPWA